jgi:hypothetical protein
LGRRIDGIAFGYSVNQFDSFKNPDQAIITVGRSGIEFLIGVGR